ncbi:MAG: response regulator [Helicobacteraceae bacterium]|nr:response regulator [Candidatus Sulfurimonas ponti]MBL6973359.1 response regulator [Sulfurimonas sp.]
MKYLVTDDSKLARLSLIKSLTTCQEDAEIFQAENGELALEILKNEAVDVVFLDLTMPVMDGYTALPLLIEAKPSVKVIVVSADIQEQARLKVLNLGAIEHVKKPINPDKMKKILESLQ